MSQRLITTEWLCYFLTLYAGSFWSPARGVNVPVRTPPSNPSTIEAQAKFFQDFFSVQLSPYKIEFGHVCEDPNTWEQRYEKKDFKNHRDMGKVRWGDKKGGYGEHYWDLNHAGHTGNHGDDGYDNGSDDGSYHEETNDPYDEPSQNSPSYGTEEYDPEKSSYEDSGRAKRAQPKIKIERKHTIQSYEEDKPKLKRKHKEQLQTAATHQVETKNDKMRRHQYNSKDNDENDNDDNDNGDDEYKPKDKKQFVLVVSHKDKETDKQKDNEPSNPPSQFVPRRQADKNQYVPYESGAGVRQHQQHTEVTAAASVPRLFLEPSTGHVVDRSTGQAYVLQPISNQY